ncbi:hypothetical protein HA466_0106650 [Hirschfeldia incana]|nr:hypothetical protein HA466_0106650 [Hirschfeldia incana]KAJ0254812.1 hypothetical protein HA466_0106650 [Hirschfeldia incana]
MSLPNVATPFPLPKRSTSSLFSLSSLHLPVLFFFSPGSLIFAKTADLKIGAILLGDSLAYPRGPSIKITSHSISSTKLGKSLIPNLHRRTTDSKRVK